VNESLKKTKGLIPRIIEFEKFRSPLKNGPLEEMASKLVLEIIKGIGKSREIYKQELKNLSYESKHASKEFWDEIIKKSESIGVGIVGFTSVDENLIFKFDMAGSTIKHLYDNGIVLGMEMEFASIDTAPDIQAGLESLRIYAELGKATNKLTEFIRSMDYGAISCLPFGGPILYPPMGEKANIGEMGRNGILVSKKYGPRFRLSMIATNASPLPERKHEDFKISEYCKKCRRCVRKCPVEAIFDEPKIKEDGTRKYIDTDKCIEYFYITSGCSVCIKVCPFHMLGYEKIIGNI